MAFYRVLPLWAFRNLSDNRISIAGVSSPTKVPESSMTPRGIDRLRKSIKILFCSIMVLTTLTFSALTAARSGCGVLTGRIVFEQAFHEVVNIGFGHIFITLFAALPLPVFRAHDL